MSHSNNLKIVRLLEPEMCLKCRFGRFANAAGRDGKLERVIHCTRLDCDNWDLTDAEPAVRVRAEDGREIL